MWLFSKRFQIQMDPCDFKLIMKFITLAVSERVLNETINVLTLPYPRRVQQPPFQNTLAIRQYDITLKFQICSPRAKIWCIQRPDRSGEGDSPAVPADCWSTAAARSATSWPRCSYSSCRSACKICRLWRWSAFWLRTNISFIRHLSYHRRLAKSE